MLSENTAEFEPVELPWDRDAATVPGQRAAPDVETDPGSPSGAGVPSEGRHSAPAAPEVASPDVRSLDIASEEAPDAASDEAPDAAPGEASEDPDDTWPSPRRQIAHAVRILCGLIAVVLVGHRLLPNVMGVGSMLDTFLPWTFVPLLVALPAAAVSRSRWAMAVAAAAACVWGVNFGPALMPRGSAGVADLRVLSQNVSSQNPDLGAAARLAVQRGADIVVLQGMSAGDVQASEATAKTPAMADYRFHLALYEFSVWSKYPLSAGQPVDLGGRVTAAATDVRAGDSGLFGGLLSFQVQVPNKPKVTVYAVHLPQPALSHSGFAVARNNALASLVTTVKAGMAANPYLVVVGDLDLAQTDRGMKDLLGGTGLVSAQAKAGRGFGFTWPAQFPVVRLDDVLVRGLTPLRSTVLGATGAAQAHRPIEADLRF